MLGWGQRSLGGWDTDGRWWAASGKLGLRSCPAIGVPDGVEPCECIKVSVTVCPQRTSWLGRWLSLSPVLSSTLETVRE